jgi:hypothetical protein
MGKYSVSRPYDVNYLNIVPVFLVKDRVSDTVRSISEKEKRFRSGSQPIIFKKKQKPDHEPFHQDYHDPQVQIQ